MIQANQSDQVIDLTVHPYLKDQTRVQNFDNQDSIRKRFWGFPTVAAFHQGDTGAHLTVYKNAEMDRSGVWYQIASVFLEGEIDEMLAEAAQILGELEVGDAYHDEGDSILRTIRKENAMPACFRTFQVPESFQDFVTHLSRAIDQEIKLLPHERQRQSIERGERTAGDDSDREKNLAFWTNAICAWRIRQRSQIF